jgi:hypothetical protein
MCLSERVADLAEEAARLQAENTRMAVECARLSAQNTQLVERPRTTPRPVNKDHRGGEN